MIMGVGSTIIAPILCETGVEVLTSEVSQTHRLVLQKPNTGKTSLLLLQQNGKYELSTSTHQRSFII